MQGVIFDLDGVLVSTDELHYQAWKKLADELGISTRMTEKHKHNAIMFLKRRLIHHE